MATVGCEKEIAQKIYDSYWGLNWAIKKITEEHKKGIKTTQHGMWLWNPISEMYYPLKNLKDIFSTLVQGTASYVFDTWVAFTINKTKQLTGQFHDELILEVGEDSIKVTSEILEESIRKTNSKLKLNVDLGIDIKFGKYYSEVH